eukprot:CFRG4637T1
MSAAVPCDVCKSPADRACPCMRRYFCSRECQNSDWDEGGHNGAYPHNLENPDTNQRPEAMTTDNGNHFSKNNTERGPEERSVQQNGIRNQTKFKPEVRSQQQHNHYNGSALVDNNSVAEFYNDRSDTTANPNSIPPFQNLGPAPSSSGVKRKASHENNGQNNSSNIAQQNPKKGKSAHNNVSPSLYALKDSSNLGEEAMVCTWTDCNKRFTSNSGLEQHLRSHTGEKPYPCDWKGCSKRFTQRGNMEKDLMHVRGEGVKNALPKVVRWSIT